MMIRSAKPRKQRLFRMNAPMHLRQHFVNVHVSKELLAKLGIKKRTVPVRKGDTVKVMAGSFKGKTAKVSEVDLLEGKVRLDGINKKNAKGKEIPIPISSSNVYLLEMDMSDKLRKQKLGSVGTVVK